MRLPDKLVDLLLISTGFGGALLVYNTLFDGGLDSTEMALGTGLSILAFWAAIELRNFDPETTQGWTGFLERFCLGAGVNLVLHAVLTYAFYIRRTPFLIGAGCLLSSALLTMRERSEGRKESSQRRYLLVGFDSIAEKICGLLREPPIGVLTARSTAVPAGIPWLGDIGDLETVLTEYRPTNIVVSMPDWTRRIPPALLLNCRLSGVAMEEGAAVYERIFSRVCCERLQPMNILLSSALRGDSRTMAIQAVYTNLMGLFLLVLLSPVLLIAALAVALFGGPGPVLESFECAGFQYIPFRLLRFRTTRSEGNGALTGAGRAIEYLHLTDLPQLLNVVRGDMALVGPRPVRAEFARYLTRAMPFYSHRFSVRPGIFGWAQMHFPNNNCQPDECRRIEYDLFYVKEGSLWMDAEIMLGALWGVAWPPAAARRVA